jgi:C-terminal processing protease CtpA/Prc
MIVLANYINGAGISGDDAPHVVVEKLQLAIDRKAETAEIMGLDQFRASDGATKAHEFAALKQSYDALAEKYDQEVERRIIAESALKEATKALRDAWTGDLPIERYAEIGALLRDIEKKR